MATRGAAALAESMHSALLAHCREALARPNLSERCGLVARAAAWTRSRRARFCARIEHDIGAAPADAVLHEVPVRSIVRAVLPHARRRGPRPRPRPRRRRSPSSRVRDRTRSQASRSFWRRSRRRRRAALSTTPAVPSGHRGFWPTGWLSNDVAVDGAHARLIEWRRSVLPAQLSSAAACWTARSVLAGDRLFGVRTLDVVLATCNAVVVHGVVGSLPVLASIVLYHLAYKAVVRLSPWKSTAARRVCAWTSCLCVLLACDLAESRPGSSRPGSEERDGPDWRAFAARGWYGRGSFTHIKALRLTALRIASHGLAAADVNEAPNLVDLIGYAMYPPLYQCGPMLPYESFRRWRRRRMSENERKKTKNGRKTDEKRDDRERRRRRARRAQDSSSRGAVRVRDGAGGIVVRHRRDVHAGRVQAVARARRRGRGGADFPNVSAHVLVFLTITWVTSHVVFGAPWAVACFVDGVASTPHDTPVFWTESSASFRRHWSSFHASLYAVLSRPGLRAARL